MSVQEKEQSNENENEKTEKKGVSPHFEDFSKALKEAATSEEKLKLIVSFMEESLARPEGPRFGDFWEARKLCVPLFREGLPGDSRAELWTSYTYLTGEAKSMRDRVDQEGQFAIEQIELALEAVERDITTRHESNEKVQGLELPRFLSRKQEELQGAFTELVMLDALASRLTALRKELIDTQIRMRHKNALFQRLSKAGDEVFPRRKELLKGVTDQFIEEVEAFSRVKFPSGEPRGPLHALRAEIKSFQSLAKALRLTPKGFHKTRQILSKCWDAVREQSEERRKEWAAKKEVFEANKALVSEKIKEFAANYAENEPTIEDGQKLVAELEKTIRDAEIGQDEVKALRVELSEAAAPLQAKLDEQEAARRAEEEARRAEREAAVQEMRNRVAALFTNADSLDTDAFIAERDALLAEIKTAPLPKFEKSSLEKSLRPAREIIRKKKEESLLSLSDNDKEALANLQEVLNQRKERRNEIKAKLEEVRKQQGASGLDFERGMELNEQATERKVQLEEAEAGMREIEERIAALK